VVVVVVTAEIAVAEEAEEMVDEGEEEEEEEPVGVEEVDVIGTEREQMIVDVIGTRKRKILQRRKQKVAKATPQQPHRRMNNIHRNLQLRHPLQEYPLLWQTLQLLKVHGELV